MAERGGGAEALLGGGVRRIFLLSYEGGCHQCPGSGAGSIPAGGEQRENYSEGCERED
jgi:hypothetical protein